MFTGKLQRNLYQAMFERNIEYEGIFYVGVLNTGIFCRLIYSVRKPNFENCKFYSTAKQFCLHRLGHVCVTIGNISSVVTTLLTEIEATLSEFSIDTSIACRQFQKRFGMSFIKYARARKVEAAIKQIHAGESLIETQSSTRYESSSGFRDIFSKLRGVLL